MRYRAWYCQQGQAPRHQGQIGAKHAPTRDIGFLPTKGKQAQTTGADGRKPKDQPENDRRPDNVHAEMQQGGVPSQTEGSDGEACNGFQACTTPQVAVDGGCLHIVVIRIILIISISIITIITINIHINIIIIFIVSVIISIIIITNGILFIVIIGVIIIIIIVITITVINANDIFTIAIIAIIVIILTVVIIITVIIVFILILIILIVIVTKCTNEGSPGPLCCFC